MPGKIGIDRFRRAHWSWNILSSSPLESPAKSDSFKDDIKNSLGQNVDGPNFNWKVYSTQSGQFHVPKTFRVRHQLVWFKAAHFGIDSIREGKGSDIKLLADRPKIVWIKVTKRYNFIFELNHGKGVLYIVVKYILKVLEVQSLRSSSSIPNVPFSSFYTVLSPICVLQFTSLMLNWNGSIFLITLLIRH